MNFFIILYPHFQGSECTIQEVVKHIHGKIKCKFTDIIRLNDFNIQDGGSVNTDDMYKLQKSDVVNTNVYIM